MRAALVGASDFNAEHFASCDFDLVVAVDGGYAHLRDAGVAPDVVVGDFDSLGFVPADGDVRRFPPEKDESDMGLACRAAADAGCDELVLYGCLGRRFDHTMGNIQLMLAQARAGRRVFAVGDAFAVAVLHAQAGNLAALSFRGIPEDALAGGEYANYLSVFAIGGTAHGVWERGLKYALDGVDLPDDTTWGLSNEFAAGEESAVRVEDGSLLVTFPLAAWGYRDR